MTVALVTGVAGQDGYYLSRDLLADGWTVHGVVRPGSAAPADVVAHEVDLAEPGSGARIVEAVRPDVVYNLAAVSSVARSWAEPDLTARINAGLPAELLPVAAGLGAAFVQASSAEMFGDATPPQDETTPIRPDNPYGASKARAHHLVGAYRAAGARASSCILFNHESPLRPPHFVSRKIAAAVARIARGSDETLALGRLDVRRDWGWAPDFARALRASADRPGDYVIATGEAHTVEDFARTAFEHAGVADWRSRIRIDPALLRPVDAPAQIGDASKARRELGWAPAVTFEQLVAALVDAALAADPE